MVLVNGKPQIKRVQTGLSDEVNVEITSGLNAGDIVVTGDTTSAKASATTTTTTTTSTAERAARWRRRERRYGFKEDEAIRSLPTIRIGSVAEQGVRLPSEQNADYQNRSRMPEARCRIQD